MAGWRGAGSVVVLELIAVSSFDEPQDLLLE